MQLLICAKTFFNTNMKTISFRSINRLPLNISSSQLINGSSRKSSSFNRPIRTKIEDYTCEWSFPIRALLGKGRRNDVIKELYSKHKARRPLVVTDNTVQNLPIIQVYVYN